MATLLELAKAVGLEVADEKDLTTESFTKHVNEKYVLKDEVLKDEKIVSSITGKRLGSLTTLAAQEFGLKKSDYEGKKLEEVFPLIKNNYEAQIATLKEAATKGNDAKVEELTKKLGAKEKEVETITALRDELDGKLKQTVAEKETTIKNFKLNDKVGKIKSSVVDKYTDDYKNELIKNGFESHIANTYEIDLDEKDEVIVKDKKTGEAVKSKVKAGHLATLDEVLLSEAEAKGILRKNNGGSQKPVIKTKTTEGNEKEVFVHPNAQKRTQKTA